VHGQNRRNGGLGGGISGRINRKGVIEAGKNRKRRRKTERSSSKRKQALEKREARAGSLTRDFEERGVIPGREKRPWWSCGGNS